MDRLNWSTLRHIATSPRLLKWRVEHPQAETPALRVGRAIHCAVLEPGEFDARWKLMSPCAATTRAGDPCGSQGTLYHSGAWYCRVKGHAPAGAGAPPEGVEILTAEEQQLALTCAESVRAHKVAGRLLTGGKSEHEMSWHSPEGVACRGRVDYLLPGCIVDLKSTRHETLRDFEREAAARMYHGQLAWYHDGAQLAGLLPSHANYPQIVYVSTAEPYDVAVYRLSKASYEAGQILYRDLLRKYLDCQAAGWYPGIAPDLQTLDLPAWAPGMQGSSEEIEPW